MLCQNHPRKPGASQIRAWSCHHVTAQTYGGRDRAASRGGDAPALPSISNPNSSSHCSPGPKQYNFSLVFVKIKQTKSSHCRSPFVWVAIPKSHFFFGFFLCFRTQKCLYTPCIKHQQNHEIDLRILVTGKPKLSSKEPQHLGEIFTTSLAKTS